MAKKNNNTTTALLAGTALIGAFLFFRPKTAKASVITPDDPFPPDDDSPAPEPDPLPTVQKKNAPAMPVSVSKAIQIGNPVVDNYATEANEIVIGQMGLDDDWQGPPPEATPAEVAPYRSLYQIPSNVTVASWIASQAYYGVFKSVGSPKIPPASTRGSGWQGYIDVWNAFHSRAQTMLIRGIR